MQREFKILSDVVYRLTAGHINYMLTGSFALNYYAVPRMTRDIDLVVELDRGDADKILRLFAGDYYVDNQAISRAIANRSLFNIIHNKHIVKVDFIVRKDTGYELVKFQRRMIATVEGIDLWIITKEDLIISKLLWARSSHSEFQLRDVRNLLATGYESDYVKKWAEELDVSDLLTECLNE
jgi:hypothetical protein